MQVVMARSPHRCPLFYGGSSADVIQLPGIAVWRFSRYNQAVIIGSGVIVHRIQENPYSAVGRIGRPCRSNFFILTQIYQAVHEFGQSASWWMAAFGPAKMVNSDI